MNKINVLLFVIVFTSCKKDIPPVANDQPILGNDIGIVCNEGNFLLGNASISIIDLQNGNVDENVFQDANGIGLGDVCQSIYFGNTRAYIVVNNSQKIIACNPNTWQTEFIISGFTSPRYFLEVLPEKAFVSDLYSGKIAIVNLNSQSITGFITCSGWSEEMLATGQNVFVTRPESSYIKVINIFSNVITDSIYVGYGSNSIVQDANGKIWILCSGNTVTSESPKLVKLNPVTLQVENTFLLNGTTTPGLLTINKTSDTLLYSQNGIYNFPIQSGSISAAPIISMTGISNYYGLAIHPNSGQIYICDALDYAQKGKVHRYKMNGTFVSTYSASYLPNHIYFR